jgi:hypothetical protein
MMKSSLKKVGIVVIAIAFAVVCSAAYAEEQYELSVKEETYQGIPFISGGFGLEERGALAAKYKEFNLKLMFAAKSGEYVADVTVEISDNRGGKVLVAAADGPWVFTNLPAGKYIVTATYMGKEKRNKVNIAKGQKQIALNFYW